MKSRDHSTCYSSRWIARCCLGVLVLVSAPSPAQSQSILSDEIQVASELKPLDSLIRDQLKELFKARDAAEAAHNGERSAEWFAASDLYDPLRVHGERLLQYAREHPGTDEAIACLAYIVDWGEGGQESLCRAAAAELIARERNNPAVSWLCSRCTNSLFLETMEDFLTKLLETSTNPTVQGAAAFHLAQLLDNALETRRNLSSLRKRFEVAGITKAQPHIGTGLDLLAIRSPSDLRTKRDAMLDTVIAKYSQEKPWTAERTFGRLDYRFRADPQQPSYGESAKRQAYELAHLRVGCIAPDFEATDIEGRSLRLSQHRGKPVLLMFSFKGCGACEAMYPTLRAVQKQFSAEGFSVLGIMADEMVATVRDAVQAGDITWRCIWDGRSGPIIKAYCVEYYPTVILIDGEGRIVSTALRKDDLAESIEQLIRSRPKE